MDVITKFIKIQSKGENDIIDLTNHISGKIKESHISNGIVIVFVTGSTGALTTIEYEPGLLKDFPDMLSRIAPNNLNYEHEQMWHDGNGRSHVKASLIGPSITIPFNDENLLLGTWQQVIFIELDTRGRERNIVLQIMGN
ncbi:MAG: secondary thiamine-phosphate synthase enzyme YjbQ [Nitrosopumilus sp.]|nr:secondary thiamine-phosphate synthase enzyme YjbQ [Nitrosopumilus sp.]MDH3384457.1 secondary thiamine-phosphate synthase enzyme YjbQ [Nitrosopumilus sp.]